MSLLLLQTDQMFGLPYARAAYLVIAAALFGYLLRLRFAQRALARRLEDAESRLEAAEGAGE